MEYVKFFEIERKTYTTEDFHEIYSPYLEKDWFQKERRKTKSVKQSF